MRGGLLGVRLGVLNLFLGQRRPNCSWASSRGAALSASGSAAARQSTLRPTAPRPSDRVRPDGSSGGTAFGAEGIATGSAIALTDAAITVPNPVAGRDGEAFAGLVDPADAGGEGNP
jgi:hypothetical protein